jgi:hypothetical protein
MSKIEVDAIEPQSGTTLTVGASGDTVTVPSGVTFDASNSTLTLPDGSVSLAKLSATGTKDATTFLRGDNTFAEAGGGKNNIRSNFDKNGVIPITIQYVSTPSTTSAVTYNLQFYGIQTGSVYINRATTNPSGWGEGASTITLMEISA